MGMVYDFTIRYDIGDCWFQVPPDSVERAAGLLFFDRLDRQRLKRINGGPKK